jgi:hypothetical protein
MKEAVREALAAPETVIYVVGQRIANVSNVVRSGWECVAHLACLVVGCCGFESILPFQFPFSESESPQSRIPNPTLQILKMKNDFQKSWDWEGGFEERLGLG